MDHGWEDVSYDPSMTSFRFVRQNLDTGAVVWVAPFDQPRNAAFNVQIAGGYALFAPFAFNSATLIDLSTMTRVPLSGSGFSSFSGGPILSPDGSALYYVGDNEAHVERAPIFRVELPGGATTVVRNMNCGGELACMRWLAAVSPHGDELLGLNLIQGSPYEDLEMRRIDVATGAISDPLPRPLQWYDGQRGAIRDPVFTRIEYRAGRELRVFDIEYELSQIKSASASTLITDYHPTAEPRTRRFPEETYERGAFAVSPDGTREAVLARDAENVRQIHEGPAGRELDELPARTFARFSHENLKYSPNGDRLYFTSRDPTTGFIEIFRLSIGEDGG
jgi:hypothetical protein